MTDATTWLNAHGFGSSWREGPVRSAPLVEAIEVGDVLDDGSLMTQSGLIVTGGCTVWLCERKAHEAFEGCELGVAFYSGPGNLGDAITRLLTYCGQLEAANNATRGLAEAAGLIRHNDVSTDVVPLLRMFLPV